VQVFLNDEIELVLSKLLLVALTILNPVGRNLYHALEVQILMACASVLVLTFVNKFTSSWDRFREHEVP
jgi:hypothetical protein